LVEERNGCARMKKGEFEMDEIVVREISSQREEEQNNMDWEEKSSTGNTWETNNDHKSSGRRLSDSEGLLLLFHCTEARYTPFFPQYCSEAGNGSFQPCQKQPY